MGELMKEYKRKPIVIKAFKITEKWINENKKQWNIEKSNETGVTITSDGAIINTLSGVTKADIGDFVVQGVEGEFYPCKPNIFHKIYERVR